MTENAWWLLASIPFVLVVVGLLFAWLSDRFPWMQ
jgi:hypothetical protein